MQISSASDLAHVLGSRRVGSEYLENCPAHDDGKESLTYKDGDKVPVVFHCHAGCNPTDVMSQFRWVHGIDVAPKPEPTKRIVDTDAYHWWDGSVLYEKVRYEPKDFRLRKPDGAGGWIWKLAGAKEVLFRLPKIKEAIETGATVFVVEGEKDVKNLERLGLIATCNTHGASKDQAKPKWTDYHAKYLEGVKQVVVLPDNDAPGLAHARAVAQSLLRLKIPVKIVELPGLKDKQDVSDFLMRGGTREQIEQQATQTSDTLEMSWADAVPVQAPVFEPMPVSALMSHNFEPPRWAIDDLLPEGLTILAGDPKIGKSWMALDIAVAISRGEKVLGEYDTTHGEVLYLALEDSERRLQGRLNAIADDDKTYQNRNLYYQTEIPPMMQGGIAALEHWLDAHPDCRLVIIDTLARFMPIAEKGVNAYQADYAVVSRLQKIALKYRIALVCVHHLRKSKTGDVFEAISGSSGITGPADANWVLQRPRTETVGKLTVTGRDIEEMALSAHFNKDTCRWTIEGDARQGARYERLVKLASRFGNQPFTHSLAVDALGVSIAHTKRIVSGLRQSGHLKQLDEKGAYGAYQFKLTDKMADQLIGGAE